MLQCFMSFHQKSWRNLFLAEPGVTEKSANCSVSLLSQEETYSEACTVQRWVQSNQTAKDCHQRLQPLSLTNMIYHTQSDFIAAPLPSHHIHISRRIEGRVSLMLHSHLYTQMCCKHHLCRQHSTLVS